MNVEKICSRCSRILPLEEFHRMKHGLYGIHSVCKKCKQEEYLSKRVLKEFSSVESLPNKEWRNIKDYEGFYQVSNFGRIKSLSRIVRRLVSGNYTIPERILTPFIAGSGYNYVSLSLGNKNGKPFSIHRLVATAFIPNPQNLPQVNHKDEDKANNNVDNLEWCDRLYNMNYGNIRAKLSKTRKEMKLGKPVLQIDKKTNQIIAEYYNSAEAIKKTGIDASAINKCCLNRPKFKTAGGYIWKYVS